MKIRYKEVDIKRQADDNENNTRQDIEDFIYKKSFESFGERDLIVFGYYPSSPQVSSAGQKKIDGIISKGGEHNALPLGSVSQGIQEKFPA